VVAGMGGIMRNYVPKPLRGVVLLLPFLAFGAWAQDTLTLVSANPLSPSPYAFGGVYTSPYGISINGGSQVPLICDDFTTDISIGESWSAIPTTFAAVQAGTNPAGTPKFTPVGEIQDYAVTAVLAAELMSLPNLASDQAGEISFALWDVFDPTLLTSTSNPYGSITGAQLTAAQGYLAYAEALVAGATKAGVVTLSDISIGGRAIEGMSIYTPNPKSAAQEFLMVSMPEPSYPVVLAMDLLAMVGLIVVFRRRLTGILS
jgi:hypothetical protein